MKKYFVVILSLFVLFLVGCQKAAETAAIDTNTGASSVPAEPSNSIQGAATADSATENSVETLAPGDEIKVLGHDGFSSSEVKVAVGEAVTWKNEMNKVSVLVFKKDDTLVMFNSKNMKPGETYTHAFSEAGVYSYWDIGFGDKAKVVVE